MNNAYNNVNNNSQVSNDNNINNVPNNYGQAYQNPMAAVSNLNKEDAMEEALSHTNQYTPFEVPKQEVLEEQKKENPKSAYIFLGIIIAILALFIAFLPQISNLFGW